MTTPICCTVVRAARREVHHRFEHKAGIGWTSYSHTGVPVQTSALGIDAELFNGYYDQTDIYNKMIQATGFGS